MVVHTCNLNTQNAGGDRRIKLEANLAAELNILSENKQAF